LGNHCRCEALSFAVTAERVRSYLQFPKPPDWLGENKGKNFNHPVAHLKITNHAPKTTLTLFDNI
jgi:hypothetical protein